MRGLVPARSDQRRRPSPQAGDLPKRTRIFPKTEAPESGPSDPSASDRTSPGPGVYRQPGHSVELSEGPLSGHGYGKIHPSTSDTAIGTALPLPPPLSEMGFLRVLRPFCELKLQLFRVFIQKHVQGLSHIDRLRNLGLFRQSLQRLKLVVIDVD